MHQRNNFNNHKLDDNHDDYNFQLDNDYYYDDYNHNFLDYHNFVNHDNNNHNINNVVDDCVMQPWKLCLSLGRCKLGDSANLVNLRIRSELPGRLLFCARIPRNDARGNCCRNVQYLLINRLIISNCKSERRGNVSRKRTEFRSRSRTV